MTFSDSAGPALRDEQLRHNLAVATETIRARRELAVGEVQSWEELRDRGAAIKDEVLDSLDVQLLRLEQAVTGAGGQVHWARDAAEANALVASLVQAAGGEEVIKVKSLTTDEIGLNEALAAEGITAYETDLAELIVQLAGESPSHILVPAIHRNRVEIRDLFEERLGLEGLPADPEALTAAARSHLRERFLTVGIGVSGANFAVAETGTICVVESEGNGRMCTSLPHTLITVLGIEKVVPRVADLGTMLRLLARSSTGERMNPYTSMWTGVSPGDGPQNFHLVLLDNGRTEVLADEIGRAALRCIRCSACLNVCPVYERTGGHAYGSTYPGPIGAILEPQLAGLRRHRSLPWASTLCGACYEVCPVKIDIPRILMHLRGRIVRERPKKGVRASEDRGEGIVMRIVAWVFGSRRRYEAGQRAARIGARFAGKSVRGPLGRWQMSRELPRPPTSTFREWWDANRPR